MRIGTRWGRAPALALALALGVAGCSSSGSDGAQGPQGPQGQPGNPGQPGLPGQNLAATATPETCSVCHATAASDHQNFYNQTTDPSIFAVTIDKVQTVGGVTTMQFNIKKNGLNYQDKGLAGLNQKKFASMRYDSATGQFFNDTVTFGKPSFLTDGTDGEYIVTGAATNAPETSDAFVYMYIAQGPIGPSMGHVQLYDNVVNVGKAFGALASTPYVSAANVSSCENCHGKPYRKHGYRMAAVTGLPDFVGCKGCHYDNLVGSDHDFQVMADDPYSYATTVINAAQQAKYNYTANVMADTHMSHAMEFDYPQSMANCVTCHAGKLGNILTTANFKLETCRSCHPVTGPTQLDSKGKNKYAQANRAPPLKSIMTKSTLSFQHTSQVNHLYADDPAMATCNGCHDGTGAPAFAAIHTGYDAAIYSSADAGKRFSDILSVTVDSASLNASTLTVTFSGHKAASTDPVAIGSITPTVIVGLYGYDTKDFIVDPHGRDAQNNRNLEYQFGSTPANPRFKNAAFNAGTNTWTVDVDLSNWSPSFATSVFRAEIAVLPTVKDPTGAITYALNAPSRTFDLVQKTFADGYYQAIVDANKCNACHDALAVSFHSPDRGGNVVVCRLCHNTRSGAGHIEMQSRSIDSYVHSIHEFQQMGIESVDFTDPVFKMRYAQKMEAVYPMFSLTNCESCHNPGTYGVPGNSKSLSGVLSGSQNIANRNIGAIPSVVTGPAQRACGGCHRAYPIRLDVPGGSISWPNPAPGTTVAADPNAADMLASFDQHAGTMGYMLNATAGVLDAAIAAIQAWFK
jgi:OmcA/MtrC family decaheme c-type cytochrome